MSRCVQGPTEDYANAAWLQSASADGNESKARRRLDRQFTVKERAKALDKGPQSSESSFAAKKTALRVSCRADVYVCELVEDEDSKVSKVSSLAAFSKSSLGTRTSSHVCWLPLFLARNFLVQAAALFFSGKEEVHLRNFWWLKPTISNP